ncbi:MAG TPA: serine/threonine-protein kinase [Kofleriaceae bacterium]|nr:serine/threonine-protein kinase [Kofleriaceae bacterium]
MERRDLSGQVLDGRYRVIEPVGKGAMGSVYRAEHLKLGRIVAVKVINEQVPSTEAASRRRFEREAKAMAKLEHPHCASVLDVGMHDEQPFVVMDFVSGQSLDEVVAQGPLPIDRAVDITRQILFGLAHAHEHGIIHRDIKPGNIALSQKSGMGDHVKILDFGLAKLNQETSNLTSGIVVGTPSYMAPEQIRGQLIDPRVDLYACGVLLFELLTGAKPFRSENNDPLEVCMMHLNVPAPRLADKRPGTDFGVLEQVVARALAKDRDQRFQTAGEFAAALAAAQPAHSYPRAQTPLPQRTPETLGATIPIGDAELARAGVRAPSPPPPDDPAARTTESPPPRVATRRDRRRVLAIAAGAAVIGIVVIVAIAASGGHRDAPAAASPASASGSAPSQPAGEPAAPADADEPAPTSDDAATVLAKAEELAAAGRRDAAINALVKARKTFPKDARLPYRAGMLYLSKMWWEDGVKQLRAAVQLDPAYKTDAKMIQAALNGFLIEYGYEWRLANFLHDDVGDAVKPFLEEATRSKNPRTRARAASELKRYR